MSNFLGEVRVSRVATSLMSTNELMMREGMNLQKGMNFPKHGEQLPFFLVLPSHEGGYSDEWDPATGVYTFEGHDSTTVEAGGRTPDQLLMYADGKMTENGKFYRAAQEYKDGVRETPLSIHVYEKLDPGVWYDKGLFDLLDARAVSVEGRKIFKFDLKPVGGDAADVDERMMPVVVKIDIWQRDNGRCTECGTQDGLRFVRDAQGASRTHLLCPMHRGEASGLLG
ncbi:hypothetical protein HZC00_05320 [Candidatus Kaiserbacteria bacterium]|nr:hypothetical protein [Candidatus Kaiserbacteria bacterium]